LTQDGRWGQARELFERLVDLPAADREESLSGVSDAELAARVRRLLEADAEAEGFLETPVVAVAGGLLEAEEPAPPERIGPYRVLRRLGRGGMGEVFLGERADGLFEQRVAIKLLRRGMATEEVLGRFARERRILARLEHPHIARLYDGGATDDGRPYFVMELVEGEPITGYCRARSLGVDERIRLLLDCGDALAAAHRNLVVHRDLKPSNVLVTKDGEVKLLDFGIAKVLGPDDTVEGLVETRTDLRLLTPAYAAPEQILGEPVTTATDVWALGALGYELLTGTQPQKRESRSPAALASVVAGAIERPSARVEREGLDALPFASPSPGERRRLSRRLRGDLDNVLLSALRREPERRYGSVTALSGDFRRHLAGQPVKARPDTLGYRVGKFVRRNRVAVGAGLLIFASLVAGLAVAAWQARRAEAQARTAAAAARRAEGVKEFLIGLFEVADPEQASGGSVTASELLDQAGKRLETELSSEPDIQADLLEAVARIDRGLGRLDTAEGLAQRSLTIRQHILPAGDAAIGRSLATAGAVKMSQGKLDDAEKQITAALAMLEAAEPPDSLATARARSDFAQVLFWKGQAEPAIANERRVYETYRRVLGADNAQTAMHLRNLGVLLDEVDRVDEAEKAYRDSQAVLVKQLGPDHVNLAYSYVNLASLLDLRRGQAVEAEALYKRTLEIRRKALGNDHPTVGQALQLSGLFYLNQGRLDESESTYREALALFRRINPKHFEVGKCLNGLALVASRRGLYADAEKRLDEVIALFDEVLGPKHPFSWQARGNRAEQVALQGRLEEAEKIQREVAGKLAELNGPDSGEAIEASARLGETLRKRGRAAEAAPLHRRAIEVYAKQLGESNATVALTRYQLAADLMAMGEAGDRAEERRLLDAALAVLEKRVPPHPRLAEVRMASAKLR
jgi:serine/threonine protein kinase/tetratricopeptide (TPR) repeat protein